MTSRKSKRYYTVLFLIFAATIASLILLKQVYTVVKLKTFTANKKQIELLIKTSEKSLNDFIEQVVGNLDYLASLKHIKQNSPLSKKIITTFYESYRQRNKDNYVFAISIVDTNGIITYSVPDKKVIGKIVSYQKHNKWALKHKQLIVGDVFRSLQGVKTIPVVHPVFNNDGKFVGLLTILIRYDFFAKSFLQSIKFGKNSRTYLLESDGTVLYSNDVDEIGESFFELPQCYGCEDISSQVMSTHKVFTFFEVNKEGGRGYAFIKSILLPHNVWTVIIFVPQQEFFASIEDLSRKFFVVGMFLFLTILIAFVAHNYRENKHIAKIIEQEQIFEVVSESASQIVFELDFSKNKLIWSGNVQKVLGYDSDYLKNKSAREIINEFIHKEDKRKFVKGCFDTVRKKLKHYMTVIRFRHKAGKFIFVEISCAIFYNKKSKPQKMFGAVKDITYQKIREEELRRYKNELEKLVEERTKLLEQTLDSLRKEIEERKAKEEELEKANRKIEAALKLKSEFLAQMSHEIRTPVNVIISYSSLVRAEFEDVIEYNEEIKNAFKAIENAGGRIIRTIELILNMTDLQTGSFEPHIQNWDVYDQILYRVFLEFISKANEKNIDLVLEEPQGDTYANVDEFSLRQIFANLIDNAIKYTEKGEVRIRVYRNEENKLTIEVSDTGIGIDEKYMPYLFDAFTQEQQGYTRKFEGNGLGLSLVKQYCDLNNIEISVESEKGKGSTFRLVFHNS